LQHWQGNRIEKKNAGEKINSSKPFGTMGLPQNFL